MSIAVDDIIEFTLRGVFNGSVATRNVFHYRVSNLDVGGDTPFDSLNHAARDVWATLFPALHDLTTAKQVHTQLDAKIIRGADAGMQNVYVIPSGERAGTVAGDTMGPTDVYSFRLQGTGGVFRNGYKRFSGVPEAFQTEGLWVGDNADLDAMCAALAAQVQVSGGIGGVVGQYDIRPVIVSKMAGGLDPSDIVVLRDWEPVGVVFGGIGSQDTRAYGRGI